MWSLSISLTLARVEDFAEVIARSNAWNRQHLTRVCQRGITKLPFQLGGKVVKAFN